MAGDAARFGTVSVRLRRVPAGRAVQRLLVLGGLLIAGWLLGCAAQSAHADELPPPAAHLVAKAPVLERAAAIVYEHEPVKRAVAPVAADVPPPVAAPPPVRQAPVRPDVRRPAVERASTAAARAVTRSRPEVHLRGHRAPVVAKKDVHTTRPAAGHVVQHPAPPAPERHGDHSAAAGIGGGVTAGMPDGVTWAPPPPRASLARASGALPPAVRTAADEPSFAPD
ncbi:hypothetical protein HUT06_03425 [Actinomadura sp. NAK00032]|uniref:hypothetical protein n=1 Tax=Actinomadura sp. NAK00032 TaxID=2742128 RepID=UPI0015905937|nr:hypothetical protein [Actinomadura sp. NAK00032]QKW33202.1 hypothetical protein HUT06_03425 [Actinomadura sp. NAK00032]